MTQIQQIAIRAHPEIRGQKSNGFPGMDCGTLQILSARPVSPRKCKREGRLGVLHGLRTKAIPHKVIVFGATGFAEQEPTGECFREFGQLGAPQLSGGDSYIPLLRQIIHCFQTGVPLVAAEETVEMFAFMEAADESKRRGGQPVKLAEVFCL